MSNPWEKSRYFYCAERERVKCQKGTFYESESHTNADTEEFEQQCFQKASMMGRSLGQYEEESSNPKSSVVRNTIIRLL
jgi:hypothetical protein